MEHIVDWLEEDQDYISVEMLELLEDNWGKPVANTTGLYSDFVERWNSWVGLEGLALESGVVGTSVRQVFEELCGHLVVDEKLINQLALYQLGFTHKNEDHIAFFGGNLFGVQVVRFTDSDINRLFDEILHVDQDELMERLHALPTINPEHKVSSNTYNLSIVWLVHSIMNSKKLNDKKKHEGMMNCILMLLYKFFTSRYYRYFTYPADRAVAEAAYAQLSMKFAIKQYGSWDAMFRARAEEVIDRGSLHHKTFEQMKNDRAIIYLLNDTQGRIRGMMKKLYRDFKSIHQAGIKIISTSSIQVEHDGAEVLKDRSKTILQYGRYLSTVVSDKNSFIRPELATVIEKVVHTMPPKLFNESLAYISDNYSKTGGRLESLLNEILILSFDYMAENKNLVRGHADLPALLTRLKGVIMSSRSTDPGLLSLRSRVEEVIVEATHNKNKSIVASVRTGVMLYVISRAITMRHYGGQ